jgi:hypothetical protein
MKTTKFALKLLRLFAVVWSTLTVLVVFISIIGIFVTAPNFYKGWVKFAYVFSPFNIWNYLILFIILSPALLAYTLSEHLEKKSKARAYWAGMLQDAMRIPSETMDIIGDYSKILENLSKESDKLLQPISRLPHPKEKIENALKTALKLARDEKMRSYLQIALTTLDNFVPDEEVPTDPVGNMIVWAKRQQEKNKKSGHL